jgi:hypothetical protein
MAKMETPAHIEIASLRDQQVKDVDLMVPGHGTPWEDRGSHGVVGAFAKTVFMAIFKPAALYALMRRPNTTKDARVFVMACGLFWSLAVLLHAVVIIVRSVQPVDPATDLIDHFVMLIAAPFILTGLVAVARNVFSVLIESELKKGTPKSLAANIWGYAAAPSVVAPLLVPIHWVAGAAVVWLWILVVATVGARSRMRLSFAGALIAAGIGVGVVALIVTGAWFAIYWVLGSLLTLGA